MNINIWIANACNLKCKYCYENNKNSLYMSSNIAESVIIFIRKIDKENRVRAINFHGGEPLLNFRIIQQIIESLKDKDIEYSMTTNGTLLSEEMATYLNKYHFNISISIDGDAYNHNLNRVYNDGSGSYNDTVKGLLLIRKYMDNVRIRMTICENTVSSTYDNILSIYNLGFFDVAPVLNFLENWDDYYTNEYIKSMKKLLEYNLLNDINNDLFTNFHRKKMNNICDGLTDSIHINTNGDIYPCSFTIDNKRYLSGTIYTGINYNIRNHIDVISKNQNVNCIGCDLYNYCAATRCKLINEIKSNDSDISWEYFCINENINFHLYNIYKELVLIANKGEYL